MLQTLEALDTFVGTATVIGAEAGRVVVALPHGRAEAQLAIGYAYRPQKGDVVVVMGRDQYFVVGVIRGRGTFQLDLPADAEIRSAGRLRLVAGRAVEIDAPAVRVRADRFETAARAVFERVVDAYRWVSGVLQTTAGRVRTVVAGSSTLHAERILETASKDVRIDGERINLG